MSTDMVCAAPTAAAWLALAAAAGCAPSSNPELDPDCLESDDLLYPLNRGNWWLHAVSMVETQSECKRVLIGESQAIPHHPRGGLTAYPALSMRQDEYGVRWQDANQWGEYRYLDEWYTTAATAFDGIEMDWGDVQIDAERTRVRYYCPHKKRVPAFDQNCVGRFDEEQVVALDIELDEDVAPEARADAWRDCLEFASAHLDPDTCRWTGSFPSGCVLDRFEPGSRWEVLSVNEIVEVEAGRFPTLHVRYDEIGAEGVEYKDHEYWWSPGTGKVFEREDEDDKPGVQYEELVRYCLPADGCDEPPPTFEDLVPCAKEHAS